MTTEKIITIILLISIVVLMAIICVIYFKTKEYAEQLEKENEKLELQVSYYKRELCRRSKKDV